MYFCYVVNPLRGLGCLCCSGLPAGAGYYMAVIMPHTPPVDMPRVLHFSSTDSLSPLAFFLPLLHPSCTPSLYLAPFLSFCGLIYHLSASSLFVSLPVLSLYFSKALLWPLGPSLPCRCAVAAPFDLAPLWD